MFAVSVVASVLLAIAASAPEDESTQTLPATAQEGSPAPALPADLATPHGLSFQIDTRVVEMRRSSPQPVSAETNDQKAKGSAKVTIVDEWERWQNDPQANLLVAKTAVARDGQEVVLESTSAEPIAYLQREGDDRFVLRSMEKDAVGARISIRVRRAAEGTAGAVEVTVSTELTTLDGTTDGTERIAGIDVPIGMPVLHQDVLETKIATTQGKTVRIALPSPGKQRHSFLVLLMRFSER